MLGIILKAYNTQGIKIIKAITIGNNTVQQKDINWSKRILGKDALAHIKTNINIQDFVPKLRPYNNPSNVSENKFRLSIFIILYSKFIYSIKLSSGK